MPSPVRVNEFVFSWRGRSTVAECVFSATLNVWSRDSNHMDKTALLQCKQFDMHRVL